MPSTRTSRPLGVALLVAIAIAVAALAAGCVPASAPTGGVTAKDNLALAQSAMTTVAPDAKLLVVQTVGVVETTTQTPAWGYLFGSPKTNKLYVVAVQNGKASQQEYGTAKLTATDWAAVPTTDKWTVDSNTAHDSAAKKAGGTAATDPYIMGMVTYVPKTSTSTAQPFVWSITFDPEKGGDTTKRTYDVNANTGAVSAGK